MVSLELESIFGICHILDLYNDYHCSGGVHFAAECKYTYVCIYIYIHIYLFIYIFVYSSIYSFIYLFMCMYVCTYVRMYVRTYVRMYVRMYVHVCMYVHVDVYGCDSVFFSGPGLLPFNIIFDHDHFPKDTRI